MVIHWKDKNIPNMEIKNATYKGGDSSIIKIHRGTKSIGLIGRSAGSWNPLHHNRRHRHPLRDLYWEVKRPGQTLNRAEMEHLCL